MHCANSTRSGRRTVAIVVLALIALTPARSQTPRDADLERVRGDIARLRERLSEVRREARSAQQELESADLELGIRTRELDLAIDAQTQLEQQRRGIEQEIAVIEPQLERQRHFLAGRLAALSRAGELGYVRLLLSMDERGDPVEAVSMLSYLVSRDARAVTRFRSEREVLLSRRRDLADREQRVATARIEVEQKQKSVAAARDEKARLVASLAHEEHGSASRLADLEEKEKRLERLVAMLSTQQSGDAASLDVRTVEGALPWPVAGKVVESFGRHRDPRFATVTTNNGIKIATAADTPVHSVYQGTVLFSQWFKGYGNLIIVDHGHRVFSLYGNLKAVGVAVGDRVSAGQTIAAAAESEETPPAYLYFEVRQDNRPVDPRKWLR